ncbi:MAG: SMP-30/gluconolactonase/LRE family protein [Balneolales bacterium]
MRTLKKQTFLSILLLPVLFCMACSQTTEQVIGEPEVITSGFQFTEGPFWHPEGYLLFSDIPANTIYKWSPGSSESEVFIDPSGNSNGIQALPDGNLVLAQHTGRISRVGDDNELVPVAEEYDGKRLNSPNDLAVRSDGLIYFTDPTFGVDPEDQELEFSGVYRVDSDGAVSLIYDEFALPNGIVFSPDESKLYVNDTATGQITRFDVLENGDVENPTPFASVGESAETGAADGMVTDPDGRLYITSSKGLLVFNEDGEQVQQISFDKRITNMAWGGENGDQLFVTSPADVYRLRVTR